MNKLKALVCLLILNEFAMGQVGKVSAFINVQNIPINIYENQLSENIKSVIMNDSIYEHWYQMTIIEESSLRYYVSIICLQYNSPSFYGWIDKKYCSVFLGNHLNTLILYEKPQVESASRAIPIPNDILATITQIADENFIFVEFFIDNKYYCGWTNQYCSSIIDNCN